MEQKDHSFFCSRRAFVQLMGAPVLYSEVVGANSSVSSQPSFLSHQGEMSMNNQENTDRFQRGLKKLKEIDGEAGEKVIHSLRHLAPDLARYTIEYPFGDVYSRPGLDLKSREIATVAALTAMGNAVPQLKVHINAALNVGCSTTEIMEIMIQMSVYAGFPSALNGAFAAEEVFQQRGLIKTDANGS